MNEPQTTKQELQISDILYVGAILTSTAQELLFKTVSRRVAIPADWKAVCHHMTIRFIGGKPISGVKLPVFGEDITLVVTEIAADERGVAVKVEPNTNSAELHMPSEQLPHITVATAPGVPAVYSNDLLRKGIGFKPSQPIILNAFVGAKLKSGPVTPQRKDAALENFKPTHDER